MADAAFGLAAESFCDTPVEAFDEAVGMRPAGPRFGLLKMHVPEAELAAVASLDDIVEVIRRLRISAAKRSVNSPPSSMRMYLEAFDGVE